MTHNIKDCPGEYCTIHHPRKCALAKGPKQEPKTETVAPRIEVSVTLDENGNGRLSTEHGSVPVTRMEIPPSVIRGWADNLRNRIEADAMAMALEKVKQCR
jgi:hypothetical protein